METVETGDARAHHVHVVTAKLLFRHPRHGIVFVREPISLSDAAALNLEPLLLYAVSADQAPIQCVIFSDPRSPLPLSSVLKTAWQEASGLRGYPDVVVLSHGLRHAYSGLSLKLEGAGIRVTVSESGDRRSSAMLREAQRQALDLGFWADTCDKPISTVADLNAFAMSRHVDSLRFRSIGAPWKRRDRYREWAAYLPRLFEHDLVDSMEWRPGDWLAAWSRTPLPTSRRYFRHVGMATWLETEEPDDLDIAEDENGYLDIDDAREKIGLVLKVWPNKSANVAQEVGVTLRDLQWFIAGKIELPPQSRSLLESILGVERNDEYGGYEVNGPLSLVGDASGPILAAYEELSRGGDLECSLEPIPDSGKADPAWRYVLISPYASLPSVLMLPRGSKAAKCLDDGKFINFTGPVDVSEAFYRDMVAACGRACVSPARNRIEMSKFVERHLESTIENFF